MLAIVLCRCHTALKLSEIGARLGRSDSAAVSQAQNCMKKNLRQDARIAAIAKRIAKHPRNVECDEYVGEWLFEKDRFCVLIDPKTMDIRYVWG